MNDANAKSAPTLGWACPGSDLAALRDKLKAELDWATKRARQKRQLNDVAGEQFYLGRRTGLTIALAEIFQMTDPPEKWMED